MAFKKCGALAALLFVAALALNLPAAGALPPGAGIVLADDRGNILFSRNPDKPYIPASILKIVTSLWAVRTLGPDYSFHTEFQVNPSTRDLTIKGFGDPLFVSETVRSFCRQVKSRLDADDIRHIFLDGSYFKTPMKIPGTGSSLNPYDAPVGALCVNFNTVFFKRGKHAAGFVSAEPQTPLLKIFKTDIISSGLDEGRIILSEPKSRIYPGFLVKHFLEAQGVAVRGDVKPGPMPPDAKDIQRFVSPFTLETVLRKLLKHSNNFMANQLFLRLGVQGGDGGPADLAGSVRSAALFLKDHVGIERIRITEGSGISRGNRLSCSEMLKVLAAFSPYHDLLPYTENDFYKTGTLHHVRTRAGFLRGKDGRLYPYVIMINGSNQGLESIRRHLLFKVRNAAEKR